MAEMNYKPRQGPPPGPLRKGQNPEYDLVVAELLVIRDEHGCVFSRHQLQDDGDIEVAAAWPGCGMEQMAFALVTEATRREALLQVLLLESNTPERLAKLREMSEEDRQAEFEVMGKQLRIQMNKTVAKLATGAIHEAYLTATT